MWVVCNKAKQCRDKYCLHIHAHKVIPFGSCNKRYCGVAECNVECEETERPGLISVIRDAFKGTNILSPA